MMSRAYERSSCTARRRRLRAVIIGVLLPVLVPVASLAQQVSTSTGAIAPPAEWADNPVTDVEAITLAEAVRLTLLHDARVLGAKQQVADAIGVLQQTGGVFDYSLRLAPSYSYIQQELFPFLFQQEVNRRAVFADMARGFGEAARDLATVVENLNRQDFEDIDLGNVELPECPESLSRAIELLTGQSLSDINRIRRAERAGINVGDEFGVFRGLDRTLTEELEQFLAICDPSAGVGTSDIFGNISRLGELLGVDVEPGLKDSLNAVRDQATLARELAELIATKTALAVERIAEAPQDDVTKTASFLASATKPFRNGMNVGVDVTLSTSERNFKGKALDPAFGGRGVPNEFPNSASVTLNVPLGKGRGRVSAGANELAAESSLTSRRERLRHTMSEEAFSTVVSYLNLIGSQESLRYLSASAARQAQFVELTAALVEAGFATVSDQARAAAQAAAVNRSVANARLALLQSQLGLAETIGLRVEQLGNAPLAGDAFPESVGMGLDIEALVDSAVSQRRDLRSVGHLLTSSRTLAGAARADLKPTVDFSLTAGMSTFYESPFFKFLPDELDEPTESPVAFGKPRGFLRAFDASWTPFVTASITVTLPFGNNQARGALVQRRASVTQNEISVANLERIIRQNVIDAVGALERAEAAVEQRAAAVGFAEQILEAATEQYRNGDITLVDLIVTEEDLTREQLSLVRAVQTYMSLLARLKFETGQIVTFGQEDTVDEVVEFTSADLVSTP